MLIDKLFFRIPLSSKTPSSKFWRWDIGRNGGPAQEAVMERIVLKIVIINAKGNAIRKRDNLRTLSSGLYSSQFRCGKAHLSIFLAIGPRREGLWKEWTGKTQTVLRRREGRKIEENDQKCNKKWIGLGSPNFNLEFPFSILVDDVEKLGRDSEKVLYVVGHVSRGYSFCTNEIHMTWIVWIFTAVTPILAWWECPVLPGFFLSS